MSAEHEHVWNEVRGWVCGKCAEYTADAARADAQPRLVAALLPYLRHTTTCALQAVRDNVPWDELCTCGLAQLVPESTTKASAGAVERVECWFEYETTYCGRPPESPYHKHHEQSEPHKPDAMCHPFQAAPPTRCAAHGQDHSCPAEGAG